MAHGLPERLPLVDVRDHVVEHGLRGAARERRPRQPRRAHHVGEHVPRSTTDECARGQGHVVQHELAGGGAAQSHRGLRLDADALRARLHHEQCGTGALRALQVRRYDEELRLRGPRHEVLHAVEAVAVGGAAGGGPRREDVEQRHLLLQRECGGGHVLPGERGQVGRLLVGVAVADEDVAHRRRGEHGHGQPEVAVGERLRHQDVRDGRAFAADAADLLRDAHHGQAQFGRAGEQAVRGSERVVGLGRRGPQLFGGELRDGLDDHLLLVVGRQVEQSRVGGRGQPRGFAEPGGRLERPLRCTRRAETLPRGRGHEVLHGLAQAGAVEQRTSGEPVERRETEAHGVASCRFLSGHSFPSGLPTRE